MLGEILQPVLNERRATKSDEQKGRKGLIDLLKEVEDENGTKVDDLDIIDMLIYFLSAGMRALPIVQHGYQSTYINNLKYWGKRRLLQLIINIILQLINKTFICIKEIDFYLGGRTRKYYGNSIYMRIPSTQKGLTIEEIKQMEYLAM